MAIKLKGASPKGKIINGKLVYVGGGKITFVKNDKNVYPSNNLYPSNTLYPSAQLGGG